MTNGDDAELEAIQKRKLEQLKQSQEAQAQREQQELQAKSQIETMLRPLLTADAWEQWNNAKMADLAAKKQGINRENAYAAAVAVIQGAKSGQIKGKVTKEQIREILSTIGKQTRREWKIRRK